MIFLDTTTNNGLYGRLSSERPFFNGKDIETKINGYETLSVSGRSFLGYELIQDETDGIDGKIFNDSYLPERIITVNFSLKSNSSQEYMQKMNLLADILGQRQFDLYFQDEPDWHYKGTVTSFTEPEAGKLSGLGNFEITCSNPHKYSTEKEISGTTINLPTKKGEITEIKYTATKEVTKIKIKSTLGYTLETVEGTVSAGDSIVFRPQDQTVTLNGVNKAHWLAYSTDFENIPVGGTLTSEPVGNLTVKYRERR